VTIIAASFGHRPARAGEGGGPTGMGAGKIGHGERACLADGDNSTAMIPNSPPLVDPLRRAAENRLWFWRLDSAIRDRQGRGAS
jgi:hypothetical protein